MFHYNGLEVFCIFLSLLFFPSFSSCLSPPLYRHISCPYPSSYPISNQILRDIFPLLYWFPPIPYPGTWLLGVFPLFRLSHMHSMWQRLSGSPIINAKVKIFVILMCSGRFPMVQSASCRYAMDYPHTLPWIRLCSVYFIANFMGSIHKDSLGLLDAQAGLIPLHKVL